MRTRKVRVLWIGSDPGVGTRVARQLTREHGVKVRVCSALDGVSASFRAFRPHVTFMDFPDNPEVLGIVREIRSQSPRAWIVAGTFSREVSGRGGTRRTPQGNLAGVIAAVLGTRNTLRPVMSDQRISAAERNVITLVAEGLNNVAVAQSLGVSPSTVEVHLKRIYKKLNVHGRVGAVMACLRSGVITLGSDPTFLDGGP